MQIPTYGVVGIINVEQHIFIAIITERQHIAKMPSGDYVYLIQGVDLIPFDKDILDYNELPVEIVKYVDGIKRIFEE